jgi:stress response protein YsnF
VEEVIVVQKRLRLKEEIRITRRVEEETATHTVTLKSERVSIEHFDEKNESSSDNTMSNPLSREEPGAIQGDQTS